MNDRQARDFVEHLEAANGLLDESYKNTNGQVERYRFVAQAQAHATLALAVATAAMTS